MFDLAIEVVLAPALVGAATLAARRWGERTGGLVSAFPAIVGPVLLVTALEHGAGFAARAASGTLLGLVALSAFTLAYARAARRLRWPASLAAGWAAAGAAGLAVSSVTAGPAVALAAAAASLALAHRLLGAGRHPANDAGSEAAARPLPPRWDLPLRMALTATLVVSLTWAAGQFGAVAGGILAALPVLASILAAFTHRQNGPEAVRLLLRGMLAGMAGFVSFCLIVATLAEPAGIAVAFAVATVIALAVQVAAARAGERSAERPGGAFSRAAYERR